MSNPENASSETRAHSILDFCERCVRDELPGLDDEETDGPFMAACMEKFGKDMKYLTTRAAAQTTKSFYNALRSADSMRVVSIDPESKIGKQLKTFHCDACGTQEHNCRYAIDLAGFGHKPDVWFGQPKNIKKEWDSFIEEYGDRFRENEVTFFDHTEYQPGGMLDSDQGRYYIGNTCLRKSKLVFLCSTMLQEIMYKFFHKKHESSTADLKKPELLWVNDDLVQEFIEMKQELELCIANESRKSVPDIEVDDEFWAMIYDGREKAGGGDKEMHEVVRDRTRRTLAMMENQNHEDGSVSAEEEEEDGDEPGSVMPSDDDDFVDDDDEDPDDDDEVDEVDEVVSAPRGASNKRPSKRPVVLDEDDDEDEACGAPAVAPKPKRHKNPEPTQPSRRSSRLAGSPAPEPPAQKSVQQSNAAGKRPVAPTATEAGSSVADAAEARRQAHFGSMPQPQPRASRIAAGLRIPAADGTPGPLGSRRSALLDLMDIQRELTREQKDELAAKLTRAIMVMQELLDLQSQQ